MAAASKPRRISMRMAPSGCPDKSKTREMVPCGVLVTNSKPSIKMDSWFTAIAYDLEFNKPRTSKETDRMEFDENKAEFTGEVMEGGPRGKTLNPEITKQKRPGAIVPERIADNLSPPG